MQLAPLDKPEPREPTHARQRDVGRHGARPDDAILLALLRDQTDACADCHARTAQIDRLAVQGDAASLGAVDPRDQAQQFRAPRPDQTGKTQNLSLVQGKSRIMDQSAVGQVLNLHDDFGAGMADMAGMQNVAADHLGDDLILGDLRKVHGVDEPPVAQDRGAVADLKDLVHLVADIDDRLALRGQLRDQRCQRVEFRWRQRRCRLVHRDDLGVIQQSSGDLDDLLLGDLQGVDRRPWIDAWIQIGQDGTGTRFLRGAIDQKAAGARQRAAQEQVLRDAQLRDMLQFLMDHRDPGGAGVSRPGQSDGLAIEDDLSFGRLQHRGQDVQHRRFSGSVLAQQAMNLAGAHVKADLVQGADAGKHLADTDERQPTGGICHGDTYPGMGAGGAEVAPSEVRSASGGGTRAGRDQQTGVTRPAASRAALRYPRPRIPRHCLR